jgi:hypothetical protein
LTKPSERRAHPRIPANLELQATPEKGGVVARMTAENLSVGGLYCTSNADFPEMTRVAVRLMLPISHNGRHSTRPLDIEAVVVRREPLPSGSNGEDRYKLALFFTSMDDIVREQLQSFLN